MKHLAQVLNQDIKDEKELLRRCNHPIIKQQIKEQIKSLKDIKRSLLKNQELDGRQLNLLKSYLAKEI